MSDVLVTHGSNFHLNARRFDRNIPNTTTPKSGRQLVFQSEFGTSDHPPPTNRTGLIDGDPNASETSEHRTGVAESINRSDLIDGRFELLSNPDASFATLERFISNHASKSPETVAHLYINGLHIRRAMALYAEMRRHPRVRVENFGHSGYSTYALYQNAEGRVFLTEKHVQTLASFIEITSDEMLASCM
jgi:hypothetical protein